MSWFWLYFVLAEPLGGPVLRWIARRKLCCVQKEKGCELQGWGKEAQEEGRRGRPLRAPHPPPAERARPLGPGWVLGGQTLAPFTGQHPHSLHLFWSQWIHSDTAAVNSSTVLNTLAIYFHYYTFNTVLVQYLTKTIGGWYDYILRHHIKTFLLQYIFCKGS